MKRLLSILLLVQWSASAADLPPVVTLLAPTNNQIITGTAQLQASSTDTDGTPTARIAYYRDNGIRLGMTKTGPSYNASFDSTKAANGSHTIWAKGTDIAGLSAISTRINLVVSNTFPEAPPVVTLLSPTSNQVLSNLVTMSASAVDLDVTPVVKVNFFVDSGANLIGTVSNAPYNLTCNTLALANGSHSFYATAMDTANTFGTSPRITAIVSNAPVHQLQWVRDISGGHVIPKGVACDHSNNVVVVGWFTSATGVNMGAGSVIGAGVSDIYIAKYTSQNALVWAKTLGELGDDGPLAVVIDSQNNIIVTGYFDHYGPLDFGGVSLTSVGGTDIFVAKYSPSGTLLWAKGFGGNANESGYGLAVDGSNNVILAATIGSSTIDFGGITISLIGGVNIALVKLSGTDGSTLWAKERGSSFTGYPYAVAVDASGNPIITGQVSGASDLGGGAMGSGGIYVAKYLGTDGSYQWDHVVGGTVGNGIFVDPVTGNVVLTGDCAGTVDFGGGPITSSTASAFLASYNSSGTYLWATNSPATSGSQGNSLTVDTNGIIAYTGTANGFVNFGGGQIYMAGFFITSYFSNGSTAPSYRAITASSGGSGFSIAGDGQRNLYAAGFFSGTMTIGTNSIPAAGAGDTFLIKIIE